MNVKRLTLGSAVGLTTTVEQFDDPSGIPRRSLGSTGEKVSIIGIGGYHIGNVSKDDDAVRLVRMAIDGGINFCDNSWDYHEGNSEMRMGKALADGYRDKVFLMSKIDSHTKHGAARQIEESLQRLQTDHLDLCQFHEVIRPGDPEEIFSNGGAFEAMMEAKEAGKVRYIGFTGHKSPEYHLHMLDVAKQRGFHFDTVQLPLNVLDMSYESFGRTVLPRLIEEKIGVLGMKPIAAGKALESCKITASECLYYALSLPTSVVITGCENDRDIQQALDVARSFETITDDKIRDLVERTTKPASDGKFEEYKTTGEHDSTVQHPQWLA